MVPIYTDFLPLTASQNAFSQVLFRFGFDFFKMLTVDLLHEFELGVWKDFLAHIIRILEFLGPDEVQAFNERYAKGYSFLTGISRPLTILVEASGKSPHSERPRYDVLQITSPR